MQRRGAAWDGVGAALRLSAAAWGAAWGRRGDGVQLRGGGVEAAWGGVEAARGGGVAAEYSGVGAAWGWR